MTPRQPFNESGIPVSEAGANFGGLRHACVREMRETCACASPLITRGAFVGKAIRWLSSPACFSQDVSKPRGNLRTKDYLHRGDFDTHFARVYSITEV